MKFTLIQLSNWRAYERVRKSARFNMLFPGAQEATGLNVQDFLFCIDHYDSLKNAVAKADAK
jgi:hypothetical protein